MQQMAEAPPTSGFGIGGNINNAATSMQATSGFAPAASTPFPSQPQQQTSMFGSQPLHSAAPPTGSSSFGASPFSNSTSTQQFGSTATAPSSFGSSSFSNSMHTQQSESSPFQQQHQASTFVQAPQQTGFGGPNIGR